jgi:NADH-quinone oxidoreductase subunit J
MESISIVQIVLAALTIVTAVSTISARNPVVSAIMLMSTLFLTGGLYLGLGAFFIGAIQILIYAGAIAVLFVFIVMLLDLKPFLVRIPGRNAIAAFAIIAAGLFLAALTFLVIQNSALQGAHGEQAHEIASMVANPRTISLQFLSKYMIPYQVAGLLILGAVMGVVVLGRPKRKIGSEQIRV